MAGGLAALLDDVAALARLAAASADDVAAASAKAGSKAIGVVIDDAAVTPPGSHGGIVHEPLSAGTRPRTRTHLSSADSSASASA